MTTSIPDDQAELTRRPLEVVGAPVFIISRLWRRQWRLPVPGTCLNFMGTGCPAPGSPFVVGT